MNTTIEDRLRAYAATLEAASENSPNHRSASTEGTTITTEERVAGPADAAAEELPPVTRIEPAGRRHRDRRLLSVAAAVALLLIAGAAVGLSRRHDDGGRVATNPSVTTQPTIHFTPVPTAPPTTASPTTALPTAADRLAPFFDGAATIDQKLKVASLRVNAHIGPSGLASDDKVTTDAIAAADPTALSRTIPGGMPPQLEAAVLVVWSELESRHAALCTAGSTDLSSDATTGCYTNGAAAAARFPADLAKARTLARSLPPIAPVSPDSHAAGEVAVQINAIVEGNLGCGGTGGYIFSTLQPVVWQVSGTGPDATDGTIGSTPFQAHYDPATGWFARLNVC